MKVTVVRRALQTVGEVVSKKRSVFGAAVEDLERRELVDARTR